jgi:hypothetical protein
MQLVATGCLGEGDPSPRVPGAWLGCVEVEMGRLPRFKRPRAIVIAVVLTALLAFPLGVLATVYSDVPDSNPFAADITAITNAGVTTGCGGGKYCPLDNVTRQEMAAFMNRLGALGPGKTPVVHAATANSTDGWSIGCPSGTHLSGGQCFDTTTRGTGTVFDASVACANLGGGVFGRGQIWRLPNALDLRAAKVNGDITISTAEWSSSMYYDGAPRAEAVNSGNGVIDHDTTDILPYRCAAIPLQIDSILIVPLSAPKDGSDPGKAAPKHATKANGTPAK